MLSTPVRWAALVGLTAVSAAWLWRATGVAGPAAGTAAPQSAAAALPLETAPPIVAAAAAPVVAVAAPPSPPPPPPMPYTYVGSWREGHRLHVLLKRGTLTFSVSGLGAVDDQYAIAAADEDQVSLRYLPLGTVQVLRKAYPQPPQPPQPAPGTAAAPRSTARVLLSPRNDSEEN